MNIIELLSNKELKPKVKTETLSTWLLTNKISPAELITFAGAAKDSPKATCIEALEFATKNKPSIVDLNCLQFVTKSLTDKAPRVKWESAKVIGNTVAMFPDKLDEAIKNLLINASHEGTVVRWSAAFALGEILKLKTKHNRNLLPAIELILTREGKNSIRKIYLDAIKGLNQ